MGNTFPKARTDLLQDLDGFKVEIDASGARADIILDRPPYNIVSMRQRDQLSMVFDELDHDDTVRVIVVRAEGEHFSSGGDIKGFMEMSPEHVSELAKRVAAPARCRKPVVAEIRGFCFGVGFELCLACDFRVCSTTARFALPEQRIGMIPGSGGSIRLLHMIGIQRAKDMTFRSRRISGEEAADWGMVLNCVADDELGSTVDSFVNELTEFSPLAQRTIKTVLNSAQNTSLEAGIEIEGQAYGRLRGSNDFAEGVSAFYEKRIAKFDGS